jgi:hypothetical protein
MNKFLNKQNAPIIVLLVIIIVLVMCTRNPVSSFIWTLLNSYKVYNATDVGLTICYKPTATTYTYVPVPAGGSSNIPTFSITGNVLILKGLTSSFTTAPVVGDIPTIPVYAVTYTTTNSLSTQQPEIKMYNITDFTDATTATTVANTVSGFAASSFTDIANNNAINKSIIILPPFRVIDYSTFTDTKETAVDSSGYNSATLTTGGLISRYVLNVGSTELLSGVTGGALNNTSVYSVRSSGSTPFNTTYYLPPSLVPSALVGTAAAYPTYTVKYKSGTGVAANLGALTGSTKSFFYGVSGSTGVYNLNDNTKAIAGSNSGDIGNVTLSFTSGNYSSITTPTNYEIRYLDSITNSTGSAQTLTYYTLLLTGGSYTTGTATTVSLAANSTNNPLTMPYVVLVPPQLILGYGTDSSVSTNYTNNTTGRYIFRSVDNISKNDVNYQSNAITLATPTTGLRTTS